MGQTQFDIGGLGNEHRRHGQIDGGSVQVERVASGNHQAHHGLGATKSFQLCQHPRQCRFRG